MKVLDWVRSCRRTFLKNGVTSSFGAQGLDWDALMWVRNNRCSQTHKPLSELMARGGALTHVALAVVFRPSFKALKCLARFNKRSWFVGVVSDGYLTFVEPNNRLP